MALDVLDLARDLIRRPSVTPADAGAMDTLQRALEGLAQDGTGKVVEALLKEGESVDHCILGEPTSAQVFGDQVKVGRRGSLNAEIVVEGQQGHVAYPHKALNPIPVLVSLLARLQDRVLDEGYPEFPASNLEITTIDVGNQTHNLIPAQAMARLNIRFNPHHTTTSLISWLAGECEAVVLDQGFKGQVMLKPIPTGDAFYTEPGAFVDVVAGAVRDITGQSPQLTTTGGISDARFIRRLCPVLEFGLVGATMHAVDEQVPIQQLRDLEAVYGRLIACYAEAFAIKP